MIMVGTRELKSKLSYYIQLMQSGEEIVITLRNKVVGYLSKNNPLQKKNKKSPNKNKIDKIIKQMRDEGIILNATTRPYFPTKPIRLSKGKSAAEMIRELRDEE